MAACDPAPVQTGGLDAYQWSLHSLPWFQGLLAELDGAIAAGGSPWYLAKLCASRDLLRQTIARARLIARAPPSAWPSLSTSAPRRLPGAAGSTGSAAPRSRPTAATSS